MHRHNVILGHDPNRRSPLRRAALPALILFLGALIPAAIAASNIGNVDAGTINLTTLTATGTVGGNQLESTVATGTAPLIIASTTAVGNLNADLLDGNEAAVFVLGSSATITSANISGASVRKVYQAHTADDLIAATESDSVFTNAGAAGVVALTLTDNAAAGTTHVFVRAAAQSFRANPHDSDTITYSGGVMAAGEYLGLESTGARLELVADGAGNWYATDEHGTLTEETP